MGGVDGSSRETDLNNKGVYCPVSGSVWVAHHEVGSS